MSSRTNREALIDGDVLVYRVAWACQHTQYDVYLKGDEEEGRLASFLNKTDFNAWMKDRDIEDFTITSKVVIDDLRNALHSVKLRVQNIIDKTKSTDVRIFLSGSNNFRNDIYPAYKAGRKPKPELYSPIREYLVRHYGAEVQDGVEADDALGIYQSPNSVICTNDKDLDMIPGWHYNFITDEEYFVDPAEAMFNFRCQLLAGDEVDNIYGIRGVGLKTAAKLLDGMSQVEMEELIAEKYSNQWGEGWEEVLELNEQLLWILRKPLDETNSSRE